MWHPNRVLGVGAVLVVAATAFLAVGPAVTASATEPPDEVAAVVELTVTPSGWSPEGAPVTIAVAVAIDDGVDRVPAVGEVQFVDVAPGAAAILGTAPLIAGAAQLEVTTLALGRHELGVRYTGAPRTRFQTRTVAHEVVPAVACPGSVAPGHPSVVRLVYLQLLGRCPDRAGFAYWVDRLERTTAPEAFARSIAATPEAVGRVVDGAYRTMLGRGADGAGRAHWVGRLLDHGRYDQLLADLGASEEFWVRGGGTDHGFVVRAYDRILGRAPDSRGMDHWLDRYARGTSRRVLVRALANEDEPLGRLVGVAYYEMLGRAPTAAERVAGVAHLRRSGDRSGLYAQLIGRPEFAQRASSAPGGHPDQNRSLHSVF